MEILKIGNSWFTTVIVYAAIVGVLALLVSYRQQILKFFTEVKVELGKCTWPWNPEETGLRRYKELIDSTLLISVASLILGAFISASDFLVSGFVKLLMNF